MTAKSINKYSSIKIDFQTKIKGFWDRAQLASFIVNLVSLHIAKQHRNVSYDILKTWLKTWLDLF